MTSEQEYIIRSNDEKPSHLDSKLFHSWLIRYSEWLEEQNKNLQLCVERMAKRLIELENNPANHE